MRKRTLTLWLFILLLAACGGEADDEQPPAGTTAGNQAALPTATTAPATAEPTATAAPVIVVEEEDAPASEPAPTPEPAEERAPATEGLIAAPFPEDVNPLTGETVSDPAVLARRPIAIKISNAPPVVRPQNGLNSADLIFEHYAEGGLTRFTAVFYDSDASQVGSIRSGRLIDLEIPKMYDAAFAFSGASGPVQQMLRNSAFSNRLIMENFGHGGFQRIPDPNKASWHTLFASTTGLRAVLEQRGENDPPEFSTNMAFSTEPPAGGTAASSLEIQYIGTNVFWQYDPAGGHYLRWTDGERHTDASTGAQVRAKNVVVLGAHHVETDILEDEVGGGHYSIQIQVWGEGPVSIFRDGQRFEGHWERENQSDMLSFYDEEGNILPLSVGNSFFQLVPLGFTGLTVTE